MPEEVVDLAEQGAHGPEGAGLFGFTEPAEQHGAQPLLVLKEMGGVGQHGLEAVQGNPLAPGALLLGGVHQLPHARAVVFADGGLDAAQHGADLQGSRSADSAAAAGTASGAADTATGEPVTGATDTDTAGEDRARRTRVTAGVVSRPSSPISHASMGNHSVPCGVCVPSVGTRVDPCESNRIRWTYPCSSSRSRETGTPGPRTTSPSAPFQSAGSAGSMWMRSRRPARRMSTTDPSGASL
ncbi:hypothetical protein [Streptomyces sp. NBC_00470]|uniref:hypothetical protein n=1 Tax=Streptomyces sp. NBC_00470 TaxID=2975753 RepID=UPI0030DED6BE